ncbi:hypothetical protein IOQ59_05360 [Pontibacterium sp. N1Y112]|uniref:Uncharacterized protein n=1 Tax=Pontibacterium sinense TaxID=2781979 RepID=A0A8J7FLE7_9GAMM|nr:hypothetical protein [Pontibacterium sinense]MBE9396687.1 hypothetical protein [Pontibacterium sinense]
MLRVLIVFAVLLAGAAAYVFMNKSIDLDLPGVPPAETTTTPAVQSEPDSEVVKEVVKEARKHINQITAPPEQSINIETADHFVTASQLLELPQQQVESRAELEIVQESGSKTFGVDTGAVTPAPVFVGDQVLNHDNRIKLQELLDRPETSSKQVYYIHAVNDGDEQGLWGILQTGLTRTFAEGIKLGEKKDKLYVDIPQQADEKLNNKQSSFLGKVLQNKVKTTYIYNYRSGRLGDDPDLIEPGQQLIIVQFSEDELIRVYNHFISQ